MVFGLPEPIGLYDPAFERDACGVGFVADLHGIASHEIVTRGLELLGHLEHRGGRGADPESGDGAGVLLELPDALFRRETARVGATLPSPGEYAVAMTFLAADESEAAWQARALERSLAKAGFAAIVWRDVPIDERAIGAVARSTLPRIRQLFVSTGERPAAEIESALFVARRLAENAVRNRGGAGARAFHVASLSSKTIVYKGLFVAPQMAAFYPDLADSAALSAFALVHQRFSTNTFPTWSLAQPMRMIAHNGEINTLGGNALWMRARERSLSSPRFAVNDALRPVLLPGASDSAQLDNAVELLVRAGRSLPHAMTMLVPEAWENDQSGRIDAARRAYFAYHAALTEPWDGPAAIAFTDGDRIGCMLDKNGLRPARWVLTREGIVVVASEVGAVDLPVESIVRKGRLGPGQMLLVDLRAGRLLEDDAIKGELAARRPYAAWVDAGRVTLDDLPEGAATPPPCDDAELLVRQRAFGYSLEDLRIVLAPMAAGGEEAIGSMGDDTALACLSDRPRPLFDYFKQRFAQVTNPAIDPLRERLVVSLVARLGARGSLLEETAEHARLLELEQPVLVPRDLERIRAAAQTGRTWLATRTLDARFAASGEAALLESALDRLCAESAAAVQAGDAILVISDRGASREHAAIPSLLATAAVHHHLVREGLRARCSLVVECGDAREVAHIALLLGYGANAVCPYLALESIGALVREAAFVPHDLAPERATSNFAKAIGKGLAKVFAKMGVSTLEAYVGAQIFEAVGLAPSLVDRYFTGTPSRVGGIGLDVLAREAAFRHTRAYAGDAAADDELDPGGIYQWRRRGEKHSFHPEAVAKLQHAVRTQSYTSFQEFAREADQEAERLCTLRGLLRFREPAAPIPLDDVEPASAIVRRFCSGAMSFGSISREAHETIAIAMNRLGARSNTGEGGEDAARFRRDPNGDSRRSAIKQVASARFGVTSHYLVNADELQIKIAQGAKPGEGGQLPGHKVDEQIARLRHSTPGVGLISPPPHHDIYSIEDLAQLIHDLKCANDRANVSVKLVAESGVGTVAAGVAKAKADLVLISGHDGGTGASPQTSIKASGVPWEIGLAETQQTLVLNGLRGRIRVQVDGGLKTGRDVVIAAMLGADEFGFATAPLVALGCVLMRVCHLNTCPVGIATQDPQLRRRFAGAPEHVVAYFVFVAEQVREILARLGVRRMDDIIGRVDLLDVDPARGNEKAKRLDLSAILRRVDDARLPGRTGALPIRCVERQEHRVDPLDHRLIELARPALERRQRVRLLMPIHNENRSVGTRLGAAISRRYGEAGLRDGTIGVHMVGTAGQSFGAFLPRGVTLTLTGDANDYVGKGLSGGRLILRPPPSAPFDPHENVIAGNVALYGATSGEAYFAGQVGERFAVRNSGAIAVVEGVGDHGCEYMTGGRVVVLGPTGRNFAAGMSGGIAYVFDPDGGFARRVNGEMVGLEPLGVADERAVLALVRKHARLTGSRFAKRLLADSRAVMRHFIKVMPTEYRRALAAQPLAESANG